MGSPASPLLVYAGRNQGPELFYTIQHTGGAVMQINVPKNITIKNKLEAIQMVWRGRAVIGTANYTTTIPEALQNILQKLIVTGVYKGVSVTPINMDGATLFQFLRDSQVEGNGIYVNGTRAAQMSSPVTAPSSFGATGTYDIEVYWTIPVWPLMGAVGQDRSRVWPGPHGTGRKLARPATGRRDTAGAGSGESRSGLPNWQRSTAAND